MSVRQFVIFTINEEEFGLDIENINSIERMLEIFKIPNAPGYIEGLANLRGKVYTIFNLRKRFNLPCPEFDENTKIIITNSSVSEMGIIVDEVKEIVKLDESAFEPAPEALSNLKERFLSGTAKLGDRLVLLLDLEKVLSEPEIQAVSKGSHRPARMHGRAAYAVIDQPGCMGEQHTQSSTSQDAWASSIRSMRPAPPLNWGAVYSLTPMICRYLM